MIIGLYGRIIIEKMEIKSKIKSILQQSWSSLFNGVDINNAVVSLEEFVETELKRQADSITDSCERQLRESYNISDSFELNMEESSVLLEEVLPELNSYRTIHSNNPKKYEALGQLIFRIEEQIIKNGN